MNKISLAITNWNRDDMVINSFFRIATENRISEIVILDDHSDIEIFSSLASKISEFKKSGVSIKLFRNPMNIGMSLAKRKAISLCENEWVIIFDSDNWLDPQYLDAIYSVGALSKNVIYMPEWALPSFDYRPYRNIIFDKDNIKEYLDKPMFQALLNTSNFLVHKETYLYNYEYNKDVKETDTVWFLYNHLRRGGQFFLVIGMQYNHLIHPGSGWLSNAEYNSKKGKEIVELIRAL